jgi:hypothetical protein
MTDSLEREIRSLWGDSGFLDRGKIISLLASLLVRIQALESKLEGGKHD